MKTKAGTSPYLQRLLERLKRLFRKKAEPEDPYSHRMAPVRRPPGGRSGAAVADPDED